jgi:prolipoprotein diacylglyceryl transferase
MIYSLLFILWDTVPEIWPNSSIPVRWYGLFFAAAFFLGQIVITKIFKAEGKSESDVDSLTYFMIAATVIGARLGHCLFYQPEYYLSNPIEIFKIWEGGLASHGATVGIIVAMWLYSRKRPDQSWLWILDRIVIVVALGGSFIRMGNLMNSEIIGKPADLPWSLVFVNPLETRILAMEEDRIEKLSISKAQGDTLIGGQKYFPLNLDVVFGRDKMEGTSVQAFIYSTLPNAVEASNGDEKHVFYDPNLAKVKEGYTQDGKKTLQVQIFGMPRHPAMVYEAMSTFILFILLYLIWNKKRAQLPEGRLFSIFVIVLFTIRFFYEFLKENQVSFESELPLNMGQFLSIPMVLAGIWLLIRTYRKKESI